MSLIWPLDYRHANRGELCAYCDVRDNIRSSVALWAPYYAQGIFGYPVCAKHIWTRNP